MVSFRLRPPRHGSQIADLLRYSTERITMLWAIIGGVVVLLVIVVVLLLVYSGKKLKKWEQRIEQEGELRLCWIAHADESLKKVHDVLGFAKAEVVFSTDPAPDLKKRLREAATRLTDGDIVDENVDAARIQKFYENYKNLHWLNPPLR